MRGCDKNVCENVIEDMLNRFKVVREGDRRTGWCNKFQRMVETLEKSWRQTWEELIREGAREQEVVGRAVRVIL